MTSKQLMTTPALTPLEAARMIGISRAHLFRLVKSKKIECFHPGERILRFRHEAVQAYIVSVTTGRKK